MLKKTVRKNFLTKILLNVGLIVIIFIVLISFNRNKKQDLFTEIDLVNLGNVLFNNKKLSWNSTISCASCHVERFSFSGDRPLPIGVTGKVDQRRAPSLLDLKDVPYLMWDGRASGLYEQIVMPLESSEMMVQWPDAIAALSKDVQVRSILNKANVSDLNRKLIIEALVAYVASLKSSPTRFDRYYFGQDVAALTPQEVWGLRLFVRKGHCSSCHLIGASEALFTDNGFHNTKISGNNVGYLDSGRAAITGRASDEGAFKTPGLRGVSLRPFFMHDGSMTSLGEVLDHYNKGVIVNPGDLDDRQNPLWLTRDEKEAIIAFLGSLTPENNVNEKTIAK